MRIAVVALGKIGLPLAVQYARRGHEVVGADTDERVVAAVNSAHEPFPGEAHLSEHLAEVVAAGRLTATTDTAGAVRGAGAVVVVVPLFVSEADEPDFRWLDDATQAVARGLSRGALVSYETTLPVGTTRHRWKPMLEAGSGLEEGVDFHLVFSPERVLTGRVFRDLRRYPKLIGALSAEGAQRAREFYEAVLEFDERPDLARANGVWDVGSAEAAELAKLAETTYRDVNIGLANEFAKFAARSGIDIYQVIEACNSQPYSHLHRPGVAVGGHCIPVYPRLYLWSDPGATVVRAARQVNATMPEYAVELAQELYGDLAGSRVVVLGAAYRAGVKETAFSGVHDLVRLFGARGATVAVHDPLYSDAELRALHFEPFTLGDPANIAVVQTDHAGYEKLTDLDLPTVSVIVDGRNVIDESAFPATTVARIGATVRPPVDLGAKGAATRRPGTEDGR